VLAFGITLWHGVGGLRELEVGNPYRGIRWPQELLDRVTAAAQRDGVDRNSWIRSAVKQKLDWVDEQERRKVKA